MEKFKAVEKAMKTKAYSKEGLSAAAKLDPKEQAKIEASEFLSNMVDELEQQIETLEAESESIQATMKKGKGHGAKADRIAAIERILERHKWHQGKLELVRRSLENGGIETEQVTDLEESIRYYVTDGTQDDFMDDDTMYDDLNLQEEEDAYGMNQENDKGSSQDTLSIQDDVAEPDTKAATAGKQRAVAETVPPARRPSAQLKSPLPTLASVQTPLPTISNGASSTAKPLPAPVRPLGEGLKYASAAAAAAASDKNNVGIAPLPPPPPSANSAVTMSPAPVAAQPRHNVVDSPGPSAAQPVTQTAASPASKSVPPAATVSAGTAAAAAAASPAPRLTSRPEASKGALPKDKAPESTEPSKASGPAPGVAPSKPADPDSRAAQAQKNGVKNVGQRVAEKEEESIYHLPASLQDLVESFEATKKQSSAPSHSAISLRLQANSEATKPDAYDAAAPQTYFPDTRFQSNSQYPQEPLGIFEDPRLYARIEPDTLFYVFYYKQGTDQQYLAARALKDQSWRFHKQYQTWFQRHEEPKSITEEFEQGTYRFFDYESTW